MKALVVRQPWATLIALGVKKIETRPWPPNGPMRPDGVRGLPGLAFERGERIAIVAGAQMPSEGQEVGVWTVERWRDAPSLPCMVEPGALPRRNIMNPVDLPLGAVVCTVAVEDALPIVGENGDLAHEGPCIENRSSGAINAGLWRWPAPWDLPEDHNPPEVTDQLPLGDFTPGRWGWLLTDPHPCEPIPCKGRQGVFALPDDVAAQIEPVEPVEATR